MHPKLPSRRNITEGSLVPSSRACEGQESALSEEPMSGSRSQGAGEEGIGRGAFQT